MAEVKFTGSANYVASEELLAAVNIAITLQKPLLVKGEPGTGKTVLAEAIATALGKKLIVWNIKSTTRAQDGLYVYDVVQRLYDSQFGNAGVEDIGRYIKLGRLGEAFASEEQVVLLIDEIDKADLEFPNDLLWELDKMEFYIPETGETIRAKQRPIVIVTSNNEKELPSAFLRRCIFHYIPFPTRVQMREIAEIHHAQLGQHLLSHTNEAFRQIRELEEDERRPYSSELTDWIHALTLSGIPKDELHEKLPFARSLLNRQIVEKVEKRRERNRKYGY